MKDAARLLAAWLFAATVDGFCNNIRLVYDPAASRLTEFRCDGALLETPLP